MSGGALHHVTVYRRSSIAAPAGAGAGGGEEARSSFGREGGGGDVQSDTRKPVVVREGLPCSIGLRSAMTRATAAGQESVSELAAVFESGVDVREGDYLKITSGPRSRERFAVGRVWDWGMGLEADLSEAEIALE
ncbi:MAG TPA: hypothetical protein VD838_00560 [Anaeromyxobacteraceae bacterium]|nr:hypothetical protein [Anaeromyxobacteraceae bacterium]